MWMTTLLCGEKDPVGAGTEASAVDGARGEVNSEDIKRQFRGSAGEFGVVQTFVSLRMTQSIVEPYLMPAVSRVVHIAVYMTMQRAE